MRSATLTHVRTITLEGLKPQWKIVKPEDVVMADDMAFVRVAPYSGGLSGIIAAHNDHCTEPKLKGVAMPGLLSISKGLATLISMRNNKQSEAYAATQCSLFAAITRKARSVHPRRQQEALRNAPQSMTLELEVHGETHEVEVLRPIHPTDNLFVAYEADMIAVVLHFIRAQGFEDATTKPRAPDLPKGIHKRKASFICKYTKPCGSVGYKTQKTLEDAVAFIMDPEHGEGKGDKDDSCGKDGTPPAASDPEPGGDKGDDDDSCGEDGTHPAASDVDDACGEVQ